MKSAITFFLVDDDADDAGLFCEALQEVDQGVTCYTADNGRRAIELLSDPRLRQPKVIFLDINMPVMSGWDCLKWIKSNPALGAIPVIMYSTSSSRRDIDLSVQFGALCLMTKPETFGDLKGILQLVIKHINNDLQAALRALPNVSM